MVKISSLEPLYFMIYDYITKSAAIITRYHIYRFLPIFQRVFPVKTIKNFEKSPDQNTTGTSLFKSKKMQDETSGPVFLSEKVSKVGTEKKKVNINKHQCRKTV